MSDYEKAKRLGKTQFSRWENGIKHHPMSKRLMDFLCEHDLYDYNDYFCWKQGGDGDNGETLMYEMDAFFETIEWNDERLSNEEEINNLRQSLTPGPWNNCHDCGRPMVWDGPLQRTWMCPSCVYDRLLSAESSLASRDRLIGELVNKDDPWCPGIGLDNCIGTSCWECESKWKDKKRAAWEAIKEGKNG